MGDDAKQVCRDAHRISAWGGGKMAAQSGHACVMGADRVKRTHPGWYDAWWAGGQKKVALRVPGLDELLRIRGRGRPLPAFRTRWSQMRDTPSLIPAPSPACL